VRQMSGRRRVRASSLLLVLSPASVSGSVRLFSRPPVASCRVARTALTEKASFSACCPDGQQSASSNLPLGLQSSLPPTLEIAFSFAPQTLSDDPGRRHSFVDTPYRSAEPQALLSTFLTSANTVPVCPDALVRPG
jgi:hypothetical protein